LHGDEPLKLERFVNRWAAAADRDRFIVVAPQGADEKDWSIRDLEFLSAAVAHFAEAFRVDPLRIAACGEQVGGSLACLLAYNDRERIRGVAAIQAPLAGGPDENDPEHRLAFYVACSPQLENGAAIDRIRKLRYPVTQRALGEKATRLNDDEQAELLRWFDTLDKL
jgi:poly(3-hydroxybutyrate) depolymerase